MISIMLTRDKLLAVQAGRVFETDVTLPGTMRSLVVRVLWHPATSAAEIQLLEPFERPVTGLVINDGTQRE